MAATKVGRGIGEQPSQCSWQLSLTSASPRHGSRSNLVIGSQNALPEQETHVVANVCTQALCPGISRGRRGGTSTWMLFCGTYGVYGLVSTDLGYKN